MLLALVVGDVLGAGIYALVGKVAGRTGGAIWAAFLLALVLALFTAFAYAELVTKYPQAAGAALYVNKAWRRPFVTFLVAFAVMCSGLTSASTLARAFGGDYLQTFVDAPATLVALLFITAVALINFRGISESARLNVVLTSIELTGLVLVVVAGVAAIIHGGANIDAGRVVRVQGRRVGAVRPVRRGRPGLLRPDRFRGLRQHGRGGPRPGPRLPPGPLRRAPPGRRHLPGRHHLVASIVVPTDRLAASDGPLLEVVRADPLNLPTKLFSAIALCALANGALINMIMASRIVYGMARERILPARLGAVHGGRQTPFVAIVATTAIAMVLIVSGDLGALADTTVLLLLLVFSAVNVSVLVLRRDPVDHDHFRAPTAVPVIGAVVSIPLMATKEAATFARAGGLLLDRGRPVGPHLAGPRPPRRRHVGLGTG